MLTRCFAKTFYDFGQPNLLTLALKYIKRSDEKVRAFFSLHYFMLTKDRYNRSSRQSSRFNVPDPRLHP